MQKFSRWRFSPAVCVWAVCVMAGAAAARAADERATEFSPAEAGPSGWLRHAIDSPRQSAATELFVLLPKEREKGRRLPVVFVLPVEPERQTRWGDALAEVARNDLADKHQAIFVYPTFAALPWYADHPRDAALRQESYLLKDVLPFV
ncbi:MAG: hypothetical protein KDA41_03290, partial [Planctomycetales bacterium]|nr:hypothetical protein [Planctomycetales bacterium]